MRILTEAPTVLGQLARLLGVRLPGPRTNEFAVPGLEDLLAALPSSLCFEPSVPQARLDADE